MQDHFHWYFPGNTLAKPARIFVVSYNNSQVAKKCKYAIRKLFHLGYRSIHINDTHAETVQLAHFLLGA
ncbi:hypothetical protein H0X48_03645 [Candidatus Dependentiae bacterium]|nr:hypothetical protein [Candidatus Dependentiae bacterium]